MASQDSNTVYSAAQVRTFLEDGLNGKQNRWIREFAGQVDDPEIRDLLNYYSSLWEEEGREEAFHETPIGRILFRSAATETANDAVRAGNVSQMQNFVGLNNSGEDGKGAISKAAERLADEGAIYLVLGPPGAGKTAFSLDAVRVWKALTGGYVLANVEWDGADETVTDSETMQERMASIEGPVLQLIDEAGQSLTSRGSEQQDTDAFAKQLKYVRKQEDGDSYPKRGSVLLIGHTRKDTAAEIRRLASGAFSKPSRQDPGRVVFLDSEGGRDGFEEAETYKGVTDTRESYREHEASHFSVVAPDDGEDEDDGPTEEDVRREEAIATVVRACKPWDDDEGMSYPEAAELVPYADSWVGNQVRAWKGGDYREIVAAPEGRSA